MGNVAGSDVVQLAVVIEDGSRTESSRRSGELFVVLVGLARARQLGITRARITQLTNLLNLSPRVQEALLVGDLQLSERRIRELVAGAEWEEHGTPDSAVGGSKR